MSNVHSAPHYQSYVYRREQSTIYTRERIDWDGGISLFSTIITPGHATRHCWTKGEQLGDGYTVTCENTRDDQPGRITRSTSYLHQPDFTIFDFRDLGAVAAANGTPSAYGAHYIPLPEPINVGEYDPQSGPPPHSPTRRQDSSQSPHAYPLYPLYLPEMPTDTRDPPSSSPRTPSPILIPQLLPGLPGLNGAGNRCGEQHTHRRGRKRRAEELQSALEGYGNPATGSKRARGLD